MMKLKLKINYFFGAVIVLSVLGACEENESGEPDEQLQPVIELSTESIGPGGETLTVDGSASTGTSEFTSYVWTISGQSGTISDGDGNERSLSETSENEVEINTTEPGLQFTSEGSGQFTVSLRLEDNGSFAEGNPESVANFTVAGSIHLSEVPDGYEFIDVNPYDSIPDYIFDGDVEIGNASVNLQDGYNLVFQVPEGAQVSINGTLDFIGDVHLAIASPSETTWKGMKIGSEGSIDTESSSTTYVTLRNAGGGAIGDYEPSALVVEASTPPSSIILETENCQGYDMSFGPSSFSNLGISQSNIQLLHFNGDGDGIYAPIQLWGYLEHTSNTLTLEADINVQQTLEASSNHISISSNNDVYIKGNGAAISNNITINGNNESVIYMEEDAALIFGDGVSLNRVDIRAVGDAPWRGIYIGGNNNSAINNSTITNAGNDIISNGAITATEKAAVYVQGRGLANFSDNTIAGSGGYGVFNNANIIPADNKNQYGNNTFENTTQAAVGLPQEYGAMFSGNDNTFTMNEGVAAVEVFQTASGEVKIGWTWESLGGSNFYHFTGDLKVSSSNMFIGEGAVFRFDAGKGFLFSASATLEISGTSENPVVMEAAGDSWGGLFVGGSGTPGSSFVADYLTIDGGGDVLYEEATEKANLVVNTSLGDPPAESNFSITNCTFSNSFAGWGAVLDEGNSFSMDLEDTSLGNTFEGNFFGAFNDKTL